MSKWTAREISHLKAIISNYESSSVYAMARQAHDKIKRRSVTAIAHKLREILSEREFVSDYIDLNGEIFPAKVVSGYVIITDKKGVDKPAHIWLWENKFGKVPSGYHVHHINGLRTDNRIENLALVEASEHVQLHVAGKPPETFTLFCYLQEKRLWEDYLQYRKHAIDLVKSLCT